MDRGIDPSNAEYKGPYTNEHRCLKYLTCGLEYFCVKYSIASYLLVCLALACPLNYVIQFLWYLYTESQ